MLPWYGYAIASSIFGTAFALFRKRALQKEHALEFESARSIAVLALLLFFLPLVKFPETNLAFLIALSLSLIVSGAIILMSRAYRHSQISQIYPLQNVKPMLIVLLSYLFLGEVVSGRNLFGIFILLLGAYALEADHHFSDIFYPLKSLFKSKYNLYFILSISAFSITSILDKYLIANFFDPISLLFFSWIFVALILNVFHGLEFGFGGVVKCYKRIKFLPVVVALFSIFGNLSYLKALTLANVSLVAPVRLLSTLFVVFIGGEFFKEKNVFYRVVVSLIMVIGVYFVIT